MTPIRERGSIQSAISVSCQLMVNIMIMMPNSIVTEVMICAMLWLRVWLMVSTSFVILLRISPWVVLSKYLSGSL